MKKLLKIAMLLSSLSLFAENALPEHILPITDADIIQNNEAPAVLDENSEKSTAIGDIINFIDRQYNIFTIGGAILGIQYVLGYTSALAHEYGHAIPSIVTGNPYKVDIKYQGDIIRPFTGSCTITGTPSELVTILLGPVAGISTSYLQCAIIKALYDQHIQKKPFLETFKQALKFPITFFMNAMNRTEKYCSEALNEEATPPSPKKKPSAFIVDTVLALGMMSMISESIYGFLPNKNAENPNGDGARIWEMILGKQSPTFKTDSHIAALCVMATPVAIGAMKAVYKDMKTIYKEIKNRGTMV